MDEMNVQGEKSAGGQGWSQPDNERFKDILQLPFHQRPCLLLRDVEFSQKSQLLLWNKNYGKEVHAARSEDGNRF